MLDSRRAIGNFGEVTATEFLLLFHAKRAMVSRDNLEIVHFETLPQFCLIGFFA